MPRIQTFLSKNVIEEIDAIIKQRIAEGANPREITMSSITSMLTELGLRVYRLQREDHVDPFDQVEFNKVLLENSIYARLLSAKVLAALKLLPDLRSLPQFDLVKVKNDVELDTNEIISRLFPEIRDDSQN